MLNYLKPVFKDKKVLITGHSGFKGRWLCRILRLLSCEIHGFSSYPVDFIGFGIKNKSDLIDFEYVGDICNYDLKTLIKNISPDYIFHFAAQALVRESIKNPIKTYNTNTMGTCYLLDALKAFEYNSKVVLITSDKVYENKEWLWGYRETDQLGGKDPYSASKAMAEIAIASYLKTFDYLKNGVKISIARAGNVIGGGDWSKDRLLPDLIRSINSGEKLSIRSPKSTRPWQHVLDPLYGYLKLAVFLDSQPSLHGEAFNFGTLKQEFRSVESICYQVKEILPEVKFIFSDQTNYECNLLQLDCTKASLKLNYNNKFDSYEAVGMAVEWYKEYINSGSNLSNLLDQQIGI